MLEGGGGNRRLVPLVELTRARIKEFLREPEAMFWTFVFPVLLAVCLGLAFRDTPVDKVPVAVVEGPAARELVAALQRSAALKVRTLPEEEGRTALRAGKVSLLVIASAPPAYVYDPTRPESHAARLEVDDALQRAAGRADAFQASRSEVKEPGARYIDFLIPGILGMNIMMAMWGLGFSIVTARLKNLLKRLTATPMRKSDYLLAQVLARLLGLPLEIAVILGFAHFVYGIRVRGSWLAFTAVLLAGVAAFSGIGLLVSSRTRTIEGLSGLMNLVLLPMWLVSGVFFSYERFPDAVLPVIRALPLTLLVDALRALINEGGGFTPLVTGSIAALGAWAAGTFAAALAIFRWR